MTSLAQSVASVFFLFFFPSGFSFGSIGQPNALFPFPLPTPLTPLATAVSLRSSFAAPGFPFGFSCLPFVSFGWPFSFFPHSGSFSRLFVFPFSFLFLLCFSFVSCSFSFNLVPCHLLLLFFFLLLLPLFFLSFVLPRG